MADDDETARAEAEARRAKILQKSKDRMNKVSGLQQEADTDDEETKKNSAARMAAMRRRRFKKGGKGKEESSAPGEGEETEEAAATTAAPAEEKEAEASATTTSTATTTIEEKTVVEEKPGKKESPAPSETTATKTEAALETQDAESTPEKNVKVEETAATISTQEESSSEPQKKYKGVAKMRREKMLQKKKEEAAKAEQENATAGDSPAVVARRQKRLKQPTLPIVMYMLTTLLLFLAGVDVGMQHADDGIIVNRDFAPREFSFKKLLPWSSISSSAPIRKLESDESDLYSGDIDQDEFNETEGRDDDAYVPNIDPIFRVDLDELTRGPGVFLQLGRGAVKIHRMILFILWEMPMQMFALPSQLIRNPPVMCLTALTIRQVLAKFVLGAKLPDKIEEDVRNTKEMADVLTMIKNAVKNTIVGAFPTAVGLYEGFSHLRMDMYVVLCGVFVGLLYSSWTMKETMAPPSGSDFEEVVPEPAYENIVSEPDLPVAQPGDIISEAEIPISDGIADEL